MAITESLVGEARQTTRKRSLKHVLLRWLAVGFGAGHLPLAPGTWGSIQGMLIVALIHSVGGAGAWWIHLGATLVLFVLAIWAAAVVVKETGNHDPQIVVIDELVGVFFCLLFIPATWPWMLAGLGLFRLFDIWKPFPIRRLEQVPGGFGIVADDLGAAVYASVLLWLISRF